MKWKRDWGLTMRIWLTMFLLFLVYLVFIAVLAYLGLGLPFLIGIVFVMAFVQYFFSDKLDYGVHGRELSTPTNIRTCTGWWNGWPVKPGYPNHGLR